MENKYYDLIISLIKQHKKYPGCEAILEDIANDVYEHTKVVINSVTNEDVVTAYLSKVVSTSIVTVPKKMNLNVKRRNKIVTILQREAIVAPDESMVQEILADEKLEEVSVVENLDISENIETISEEDLNFDEPIENFVEEAESTQEEVLELDSFDAIKEETVDKTLVDKMINGVQSIESSNIESEINPEEEEDLTEIYETLEEVEAVEEVTETIEEEIQEESEEETFLEEVVELTSEETLPEESIEEFEETSEEIEEVELDIVDSDESFESIEDIENLNKLDVIDLEEPVQAFDIEEIAESSNIENLDVENEEILELDTDSDNLLEENCEENYIEIDEEIPENEESSFAAPTYEYFNYEPETIEYDAEEILSYLKEINEKHPEKQILTICDLKYKQGFSVKEIAEKLNFSLEDVIEILTEIIDTIKD